jgi:hypothetical protein
LEILNSDESPVAPQGQSQELVVALFDVLGFEDRLGRFPLEQIYAQYRELISIASSKSSHPFLDAWPTGDGTSAPFLGFVEIEQDYFSDTILIWTRFSPRTFSPFLHVCCNFMCEALQAKLPLRGAISIGNAIMDKSTRTYIGPPLVEAARAEKAQQWIGLCFGHSFTTRKDVPFRADLARPYDKHLKPGSTEVAAKLVVDWPRIWRGENRASARSIVEHLSLGGKVPEYYKCTMEFVVHSDANPEWWKSYQQDSPNG